MLFPKKPKSHQAKVKDFLKIYDKYNASIYRFFYLRTNSLELAQDLTSEVFLKFWQEVRGREIKYPKTFIFRLAQNLLTDFYRQRPYREIVLDEEKKKILENTPDPHVGLAEASLIKSDFQQVQKALQKLSPEEQNLIIWRYLEDFSPQEIAEILDLNEGTIRVKVHRALKKLKKIVEDENM